MGGKRNTGELRNCLHCGKQEYIPKYRLETHKFCSRTCAYHWKTANETISKVCLVCSAPFSVINYRSERAKYCSDKCRYESMKGRGRTTYTCHHCSMPFQAPASTNRKYCSMACVGKGRKEDFKPVYSTVRKAMLRRNMVEKCERCGFDEPKQILGIHHKDRNRHNNELSNLEVLCPNCHSMEHMKHVSHGFKE